MKTALVLRHLGFEDLGVWHATLGDCGYQVAYCDVPRADFAGMDAVEPDLVVVLGAPIGACDDALFPFLAPEVELIERRLAAGKPLLGGDEAEVLAALRRNTAYLQREVAQRLGLKFAPRLQFHADESFDEAERIERLLNDPKVARDLGELGED